MQHKDFMYLVLYEVLNIFIKNYSYENSPGFDLKGQACTWLMGGG